MSVLPDLFAASLSMEMTALACPSAPAMPLALFGDVLRSRRGDIEKLRRLPDEVLTGLLSVGLGRLCVPRRFGGDETDPVGFMRIVEEVARADAATAWCVWIYGSAPWFLAHADGDVAAEVWSGGPDVLIASPLAPCGVAEPAVGGYRLSGRWPFASGSVGADWVVCRAALAGSPRSTRLMLVPAASVVCVDTWSSVGLCGTGSGDVVIDDLFVPEPFAIDFDGGVRRWPEPLYGFPHRGLAAVSATIALGIARDALDELVSLAATKHPALGSGRLAERPVVQAAVARAEVELGSARAFLYECTEDVWRAVLGGGAVPDRGQAMLRAAANHTCRTAARVVDLAYGTAGGSSVYRSSPLQKHFRDIHTLTQHFFHSDEIDEMAGRVFLGVTGLPSRL